MLLVSAETNNTVRRISAKPKNITIVQIYAETSAFEDLVVEFYEQLYVPRKDLRIIQGNWNYKVGPGAYGQRAGTVGRFGVVETNERRERLLEFARRPKVASVNTVINVIM